MRIFLSAFLLSVVFAGVASAELEGASERFEKRQQKQKEREENSQKSLEAQLKAAEKLEELVKQNAELNTKIDKLIESNETQNALLIELLSPEPQPVTGKNSPQTELIDR